MSHTLRRDEITKVLRDAGVEFEEDATMVQLRPLYDETVAKMTENLRATGNQTDEITPPKK